MPIKESSQVLHIIHLRDTKHLPLSFKISSPHCWNTCWILQRGKHANKHAHGQCQRVVRKLMFGIAEELSSPRMNAETSPPIPALASPIPHPGSHWRKSPWSAQPPPRWSLALARNSMLQAIDMRPACTGNPAWSLRTEPVESSLLQPCTPDHAAR